jgi:putative transcriptional regulator
MRRTPEPTAASLQGMLLVAHPSLRDPNFRRSVIFLSAHDAQAGAFGLILNRPLDKVAADLLPGGEHPASLGKVPVYLGGPVGHDQLTFVQIGWESDDNGVQVRTNLSLEEVAARIEQDAGQVRAFVGYAGWAAGQLEAELLQRGWLLVKPDPQSLVTGRHEKLWKEIMEALGPKFKLLAAAPDDPSLN